jgi:thiol-disulfide isomerase/thioredoxin
MHNCGTFHAPASANAACAPTLSSLQEKFVKPRNTRPFFALTVAAGLAVCGAACETSSSAENAAKPSAPASASPTPAADKPTDSAKPAPDFSLAKFGGGKFSLQEHRGKVVVVNFWATWCGPCVAEMPGFNEVYKEYKSKGLEIVGLAVSDEEKSVETFIQKRAISYPIAMGTPEVGEKFGIGGSIPFTVFIDRKGNLRGRFTGSMSRQDFAAKVKSLLDESA